MKSRLAALSPCISLYRLRDAGHSMDFHGIPTRRARGHTASQRMPTVAWNRTPRWRLCSHNSNRRQLPCDAFGMVKHGKTNGNAIYLVGGLEHFFYFSIVNGDNPSH